MLENPLEWILKKNVLGGLVYVKTDLMNKIQNLKSMFIDKLKTFGQDFIRKNRAGIHWQSEIICREK